MMAALPTAVKLHIVTALACFESPAKVAISVKANFGLIISRQRIEAWNPERCAGAKLDSTWRSIFYDTRKRLLVELEDIPIFHRSYRLRGLERMAHQAENMGNVGLAAELIVQAAKEMGGFYVASRTRSSVTAVTRE
jgi:hypothetical protein